MKRVKKIQPIILGALAATIAWCLAKGGATEAEAVAMALVAALVSIEVLS